MDLNIAKRLGDFYSDSRRVLEVSYKPDMTSFKRIVKIVVIGTLILGILGFIIETIIALIT